MLLINQHVGILLIGISKITSKKRRLNGKEIMIFNISNILFRFLRFIFDVEYF